MNSCTLWFVCSDSHSQCAAAFSIIKRNRTFAFTARNLNVWDIPSDGGYSIPPPCKTKTTEREAPPLWRTHSPSWLRFLYCHSLKAAPNHNMFIFYSCGLPFCQQPLNKQTGKALLKVEIFRWSFSKQIVNMSRKDGRLNVATSRSVSKNQYFVISTCSNLG